MFLQNVSMQPKDYTAQEHQRDYCLNAHLRENLKSYM